MDNEHCISKIIALGFLCGSLLCAIPTKHSTFEKSLNYSQNIIWKNIQYERFYIYMISLSIASAVTRSINANVWKRVLCMFILIASLYMIFPKSTYMRTHITKEQNELLNEVYKQQQLRYHGSIVLAIIAAPFMC